MLLRANIRSQCKLLAAIRRGSAVCIGGYVTVAACTRMVLVMLVMAIMVMVMVLAIMVLLMIE